MSFPVKINIISCEDFGEQRRAFGRPTPEYPQLFADLFRAAGTTQFAVFDAKHGELPRPEAGAKYVITGSLSSAYDADEWIAQLKNFVRAAFAANAKIAGICFGHQLVADALGGHVERAKVGWGEGIRFSPSASEFMSAQFPDGGFWLDYNHHDQVLKLPDGAERLSGSEFCPVESFGIGNKVLCFQGHPEFTREYSDMLFSYFKNEFPAPVQTAREAAKNRETDRLKIGKIIAEF